MQTEIEDLFDTKPAAFNEQHFALFQRFKDALNSGEVRSAEPDASTRSGWRVNTWVKKGILLGFRMGGVVDMSVDSVRQPMLDKATWPVKRFTPESVVRMLVVF
jgi:2,3,4,5-tetrahydropyridine-2-carboxylate N-succinyltransferase